jgi:hypothetical protein
VRNISLAREKNSGFGLLLQDASVYRNDRHPRLYSGLSWVGAAIPKWDFWKRSELA